MVSSTPRKFARGRARDEAVEALKPAGKAVRALADSLATEALTLMGEQMRDCGEGTPEELKKTEYARRAAARDIMYVWSRLPPDEDQPTAPLTREQAIAHMRSAFRDPDDSLLEAMRAEADAIRKVLGE